MYVRMGAHQGEVSTESIGGYPPGYRFAPTEEELVTNYLRNKVSNKPLPAEIIQEMNASELYNNPPNNLVEFSCGEKEWFFFIHKDTSFHGKTRGKLNVGDGNGMGFWKPSGEEMPICNSHGDPLAFKLHLTYFSRNSKRTHWKIEEYRIPNFKGEEWALVRMRRGKDYHNYL